MNTSDGFMRASQYRPQTSAYDLSTRTPSFPETSQRIGPAPFPSIGAGNSYSNIYNPSAHITNSMTCESTAAKIGTVGIRFMRTPEEGNPNEHFEHFIIMSEFKNGETSTEEHRFEDYKMRRKGLAQFPKKQYSSWGNTGYNTQNTYASVTSMAQSSPFPSLTNTYGQPAPKPITTSTNYYNSPGYSSGNSTNSWIRPPAPITNSFTDPTTYKQNTQQDNNAFAFRGANPVQFPQAQSAPFNFATTSTQPAVNFNSSFVGTGTTSNAFTSSFVNRSPFAAPVQPFSTPQNLQPTSFSFQQPSSGFAPAPLLIQPQQTFYTQQQPFSYNSPITSQTINILDPSRVSKLINNPPELITPEYSDPHGIKGFLTQDHESFKQTTNLLGNVMPIRTPYDDDDLLRSGVNNPQSLGTEYTLVKTKPSDIPQKTNFQSFSPKQPIKNKMFTPSLLRQVPRETMENVNLTVKKCKPKEEPKYLTTTKYDENTLRFYVMTSIKKQEETVQVLINRSYRVRNLKEEAIRKLKEKVKLKKKSEFRLIKHSKLLNDNDVIQEAKLEDEDILLLVNENKEEGDSSSEEEKDDIAEVKSKEEKKKKLVLAPEDLIPKLNKIGYETIPPMKLLCRMSEEELMKIKNFTIQNMHGKIIFEGETDVRGLDLDAIVEIKQAEIEVYRHESQKIEFGSTLDKPAEVHLYSCFPKKAESDNEEKFIKKLKASSKLQDVINTLI